MRKNRPHSRRARSFADLVLTRRAGGRAAIFLICCGVSDPGSLTESLRCGSRQVRARAIGSATVTLGGSATPPKSPFRVFPYIKWHLANRW